MVRLLNYHLYLNSMKYILLSLSVFLLFACSNTYKESTNLVNAGRYHEAFVNLANKYQKNISQKKRDKLSSLLQKSYAKALEKDESRIRFLKQENLPTGYEEIYNTLIRIEGRQKKIDPFFTYISE